MRPLRLLSLAFLLTALTALVVSAAPREFTGEIDGALYHIVAPEGDWKGSLWIEAHGHRNEGSPLVASLSRAHPFNVALLGRGWAIATTSYRRNGIIVDDAIADLLALRTEAAAKLGEPKIVIIEGSSMGGGIATLIAESSRSEKFTGIVAAGAALQVVDPQFTALKLTHAPRIPIVFLTNQSELDGPAAYVIAARERAEPETVRPVLWKVLRDGHVNVNAPERLGALEAVVAWATTGVSPGDRDDATVALDAGPSTAQVAADGTLRATVRDLARVYGNLYTDLQPADFEQLGIERGGWFLLTSATGTFKVRYGTTYSDVPQGEWIAFPTADGTVMIARNRANAAETAGLATGDTFTVAKAP
jgi:pimeloyl-ACP methyl ester carboxylesterase